MRRLLRMGLGLAVVLAAISATHITLNHEGRIRAARAARGELTVGHLPVT